MDFRIICKLVKLKIVSIKNYFQLRQTILSLKRIEKKRYFLASESIIPKTVTFARS